MTCYFPLDGWQAHKRNENGKRPVVFSLSYADTSKPLKIACGKCIGCRLKYSRDWAIRMTNEASLYEHNCFITLTFDDKHLLDRPNPYTIDVRDIQLFLKRLRNKGFKFRYFYCGEYGEINARPHYHLILFDIDFPDKELLTVRNGYKMYRSALLEQCWPYGFSSIGSFTFESAGYVARYITKKQSGDQSDEHYTHIDENGQIFERQKEFCQPSRIPGLGSDYYDKYKHYMFENDFIVINGTQFSIPRYYNDKYRNEFPDKYAKIKRKRIDKAQDRLEDNTSRRMLDKYRIKLRQFSKLVRPLER